MHNAKGLLLASVAIVLIGGPQAFAAPHTDRPILLAQAADPLPEAVAAAQAKVDAASAALQQAVADGKGVKEARKALRAALKELNDARATAGLPPVSGPPEGTADQPPPDGQNPPAAAKTTTPPAHVQPPATAETPPPPADVQPPAAANGLAPTDQVQPPATAEGPPALKKKGKKLPPPADASGPPPVEQQNLLPTDQAKTPPPPPPPPPQAPALDATGQPPATPPPPLTATGQPPKFDPSLLKKPHPRFGDVPNGDATVQLPKQDAQIPTGGEINAGAGRIIVKEDNGQITVRHDDTDRFRQLGGNVDVQQGRDGTTTTTINRPGGVQIVTIMDRDGNILQRYRKGRDGTIQVLIGEAGPQPGSHRPPPPPMPPAPNATFDFHVQLPPLRLNIPQDQYIVESSQASRQQLTQTFAAPPVEQVERPYSLEEIRRSDRIRNKVRRVDFDTVTFEFGSAVLPDDQIPQMQGVGEAMRAVLDRNPGQVFLIEGHTDAVGSDLANLALSDRRAETVAEILTYYFNIPPEDLVTQGYGEQFLKVPTNGPERENRRVAFRNITQLMRTGSR